MCALIKLVLINLALNIHVSYCDEVRFIRRKDECNLTLSASGSRSAPFLLPSLAETHGHYTTIVQSQYKLIIVGGRVAHCYSTYHAYDSWVAALLWNRRHCA